MHVFYNVCHVQIPLREYDYKINNVATDLRDGVRLTRLVELLLYPSVALAHRTEVYYHYAYRGNFNFRRSRSLGVITVP